MSKNAAIRKWKKKKKAGVASVPEDERKGPELMLERQAVASSQVMGRPLDCFGSQHIVQILFIYMFKSSLCWK